MITYCGKFYEIFKIKDTSFMLRNMKTRDCTEISIDSKRLITFFGDKEGIIEDVNAKFVKVKDNCLLFYINGKHTDAGVTTYFTLFYNYDTDTVFRSTRLWIDAI